MRPEGARRQSPHRSLRRSLPAGALSRLLLRQSTFPRSRSLRVCLDAAEADPSHLDMVAAAPATATVLTAEWAEAAAAMEDANHGLVNFQLVPKVGASCQ